MDHCVGLRVAPCAAGGEGVGGSDGGEMMSHWSQEMQCSVSQKWTLGLKKKEIKYVS